MAYTIPEKLKRLEIYEPVTEIYDIRLDANESFQNLPDDIRRDVLKAVEQVEFNRYPDPFATKLCEKFGRFFHVKPELLTAGNGSDELISLIVPNFLESGDTMLVALPDFSMYTFYAQMNNIRVEALQKAEDMVTSAADILERAKAKNARLLIFSNPCNPTSLKLSRDDIITIIEGTDALVIVDEAYMDFAEGSVLDVIEKYDNLIVLKTCSKALGLAAIRLGFAAAGKELTDILHALKSPYNVNSLTQAVGCAVLDHPDYIKNCIRSIQKSRDELYQGLLKLKEKKTDILSLYPTVTNFIFMKVKNADKVFEEMKKKSISIRYMNGYLRVTAGRKLENEAVLRVLDELLDQ